MAQGFATLCSRPARASSADYIEGVEAHAYLKASTALTLVVIIATFALAACTSMTGKTAGENVDDATITSEVKTKLAAEKISTLTKIGVDTDRGTVYLTGTVNNAEMRSRAEEIARGVKHVGKVVNNLTVRAQ